MYMLYILHVTLLLLLLLFTVGILLYLQDVCAYVNSNGEVKSVCFKSTTRSPETYFSGRLDPITISFSGGGGRGTVPGGSQIYLFSAQGNETLSFSSSCAKFAQSYMQNIYERTTLKTHHLFETDDYCSHMRGRKRARTQDIL